MFTGLIEELGEIKRIESAGKSRTLAIRAQKVREDLESGSSMAIDGVCLTVTRIAAREFEVFLSMETVERTTLGNKQVGDKVNLERAVKVGQRLGGHFVLGHVDTIGQITGISRAAKSWVFNFSVPLAIMPYLAPKGSIAVDGISLTVVDVFDAGFSVAIIPYTLEQTTLAAKKVGDQVNIEADILARYMANLLTAWPKLGKDIKPVDKELLERTGFID